MKVWIVHEFVSFRGLRSSFFVLFSVSLSPRESKENEMKMYIGMVENKEYLNVFGLSSFFLGRGEVRRNVCCVARVARPRDMAIYGVSLRTQPT
jgi:hypothetical protein